MVSKLQRDTFLLNQLQSVSVGKDKHKHKMEVFCLWNKNLCLSLENRNTPQIISLFRTSLKISFYRAKTYLKINPALYNYNSVAIKVESVLRYSIIWLSLSNSISMDCSVVNDCSVEKMNSAFLNLHVINFEV